ncbi:hypothetical protein [Streptococcus merionis]
MSKRNKVSIENKLTAVRLYLEQEVSVNRLAKQYSASEPTISE